jgi:hypothetical protein
MFVQLGVFVEFGEVVWGENKVLSRRQIENENYRCWAALNELKKEIWCVGGRFQIG